MSSKGVMTELWMSAICAMQRVAANARRSFLFPGVRSSKA
jgi:hypothetical protein